MRAPSAAVRTTHWLTAVSFAGLVVSGIAILLAHPRFYWGETGVAGMPALIDLPLPLLLEGQTGWGRSLHFLSAWTIVASGLVYVWSGVRSGHFRWRGYTRRQRFAYAVVVFGLLPLMIWTGLAMSPAVDSVVPAIVQMLGGHQSARTIHFIAAVLLALFLVAHLVMVSISGFTARMRSMIIGREMPRVEPS